MTAPRPTNLKDLRDSGWQSKSVKHELRDNYLAALQTGDTLFPGIVGYDSTVVPEVSVAVLAGHDILFLGEPHRPPLATPGQQVRIVVDGLGGLENPVRWE